MANSPAADKQSLRTEVGELNSIIRELWLRVVDAGSLMNTSWVRDALEGSTELSDQDYVRNAFKLPAHVRDAVPAHVAQD
ncbi:hypothetical protein [Streptomyces bugieae]|uniref:Uncharacterized protein n=1 Tax=Streptomyces bugieae TaxID=3098223 RepID=A0ABU7NKX7_9ACTN|nr:hypothetical protein [Streptomyces sp. DSM 41528]